MILLTFGCQFVYFPSQDGRPIRNAHISDLAHGFACKKLVGLGSRVCLAKHECYLFRTDPYSLHFIIWATWLDSIDS